LPLPASDKVRVRECSFCPSHLAFRTVPSKFLLHFPNPRRLLFGLSWISTVPFLLLLSALFQTEGLFSFHLPLCLRPRPFRMGRYVLSTSLAARTASLNFFPFRPSPPLPTPLIPLRSKKFSPPRRLRSMASFPLARRVRPRSFFDLSFTLCFPSQSRGLKSFLPSKNIH